MVNITNEFVPYFGGETSLDTALSNAVELFLDTYKAGTFVCDVCGEIVYPKVTTNEHGIFIESESAEIRGGLRNHITKKNVCKNCHRTLSAMEDEERRIGRR